MKALLYPVDSFSFISEESSFTFFTLHFKFEESKTFASLSEEYERSHVSV